MHVRVARDFLFQNPSRGGGCGLPTTLVTLMSFVAKALKDVSFSTLLVLAFALRVILIFYSEWHDQRNVLKYTDIDYHVFTDAARYLLHPSPPTPSRPENVAQGPFGRMLGLGE